MESYSRNPELAKYMVAAEAYAILRGFRLSKTVKTFVKNAWLLAEADLKKEQGDSNQEKRITRITERIKQTPVGERLLNLSDQIRESLVQDPHGTRIELQKVLSKKSIL